MTKTIYVNCPKLQPVHHQEYMMRIGNFAEPGSLLKPDKSTRLKKKAKELVRPGNDPAHLECIRQLRCCIPDCQAQPRSDPHHLKCSGERGMGQRSSDKWAIPMCRDHHTQVEGAGSHNEEAFFKSHELDVITLAMTLWFNSKNIDRMSAVLDTHRKLARERKSISEK